MTTFSARLRQPRFGILFLTSTLSLLVSLHWWPMAGPSLLVLLLCLVRPEAVTRPLVWWLLAGCWGVALVIASAHMEDHVPLFAIWLVAIAVCLRHGDDDSFLSALGLQARLLIGLTFTIAVLWKLWFGTYLDGVTLWMFMIADDRFGPLASAVLLSDHDLASSRAGLSDVLDGTSSAFTLEGSDWTAWAIVVVAVTTLLLEGTIALSHLAPDSSPIARLRLPSVVLFGVVTYGVVPVVPFAVLLALLTMSVARWRSEVMWVLPIFMIVVATRVATLSL